MPVPDSQLVPVGNDYLETRARLGTALFALRALAAQTHAAPATLDTLAGLGAGLHEPLLFVVIGEVKAGKSSLLNALFGRALCRTGVEPITDAVEVFKYGEPARDVRVSAALTERFQPIRLLRDFHLVDTPGTNSIAAEHQAITERFVPRADLVVFVFNVVNPWGETTWKFLEHLHRHWLKNALFVLQQSDLRDERDIAAITNYLRQTALARLGQAFPIFAVSAKKAFLAKTDGIDKERLWAESGFEPLEKAISQLVASGEARREKLRAATATAQTILREGRERTHRDESAVAADRTRLTQLRDVVEELKRATLEWVASYARGLEAACDRVGWNGEAELSERLQPWSALKLRLSQQKGWLDTFGQENENELRTAVAEEIETLVARLEHHLRLVWQQLHEQFRTRFNNNNNSGGGNDGHDGSPGEFERQRAQLVGEVGLVMLGQSTSAQTRQQMEELFPAPKISSAATATAVAGAGPGPSAHLVAHLASLDLFDFSGVTARLGGSSIFGSRPRMLAVYRAEMMKKRDDLARAMIGALQGAMTVFYEKLAAIQRPLEMFCAEQEVRCRPLLEQVKALETNLAGIAGEL